MQSWHLIILVLAALALVAGCAGESTLDAGAPAAESAAQILPANEGQIPSIPLDREPSDGPGNPPGDPEFRIVLGNEYLAMHNCYEDGAALVLDAPGGDDGDLAWAVYRFSYLHGMRPLLLTVETLPIDFGDEYWVGIANYTKGIWEWFGPTTLLEFEVDLSESTDRYITGLGNFYFILLAEPDNTTKHVQSTLQLTTTGGALPGAPTDLTASDGEYADKVALAWGPGDDATGYILWRADDDGAGGPDEDSWQVIGYTYYTTYDDYEVEVDTVYYYRAQSFNDNGYSGFSNVDSGYAQYEPPPTNGLVWGKVLPIGEDFENMTAYLAGLTEVQETTLNVYGIFQFNELPWGTYLVTVHHPQRDFYPQYFQVSISADEPQAWVEFEADEATDFSQIIGYTWRYDPETGYIGIYGTKVTIEKLGFTDKWERITNGYGWFSIGELETNRYYRITPTRTDMLFEPENRTLFLGGYALPEPLFFKGALAPP